MTHYATPLPAEANGGKSLGLLIYFVSLSIRSKLPHHMYVLQCLYMEDIVALHHICMMQLSAHKNTRTSTTNLYISIVVGKYLIILWLQMMIDCLLG